MRYPAQLAAVVFSLTAAGASQLKGDDHTLAELFAGASLTAGGLTFSNWHVDLAVPPKFGMNNQDIGTIVIAATSEGGPVVQLRWDAAAALETQGRDEINFVLRYTVSAQTGFVALAKTHLVNYNLTGRGPGAAPFLSIEESAFVAGTLEILAFLDVDPSRVVDLAITYPVSQVDVATHIVLTGEQNDDNPAEYDYVSLGILDQSFWRAARILTVNSAADAPDGNIGDGIADTGTVNAPTGITTLRAALNEADGTPDLDVIHFEIPGAAIPTIQPRSDFFGGLGALHPVIVDGYSQAAGWVELDGSSSAPPLGGLPTVGFELVGRDSAVRGLVINRFQSHGIQVRQSGAPFKGNNVIIGNHIGTDSTGTQSLGNNGDGIRIVEQPDNAIGGFEPNLIVNNGGNGVSILGAQSVANSIGRNTIRNNQEAGVYIAQGAGLREVEGSRPIPAIVFSNVITGNGGAGVRLDPTVGDGNEITVNSISANGGLGIDAGTAGPTPDGVPVLVKVISADGMTMVDGTLQGEGNRRYDLEFFINTVGDPSTFGEGERFLGRRSLFTDASGRDQRDESNPGFPFFFALEVPAGHVVTATATKNFGNTSEFSQWMAAVGNALPNADAGNPQTVTTGTKVTLDGTASNDPDNGPGPLTFFWEQLDGPAVALNNATSATPDFTPVQEGVYSFILTVRDGLNFDEDAIAITVTSATSNQAPTARATAPASATIGQNVVLDGSSSSDPDNGPGALTYSWTQLSGPNVVLTGAGTAMANFTPEVAGSYEFRLTVNDGAASSEASVTVVVGDVPENAIHVLMTEVQALVLDAKLREGLLEKLSSALVSLQRGNSNAAQGQLAAFLLSVEALEHSRKLPSGTAQDLVDATKAIIASIDDKSGRLGPKK